ncbi:GNAT family protein [Viridibacterium curvum]|uniref:GNAT family protein n=1 Tax=Viridibacterium curvum TaxID=1101404 RepID=A0ABP9QMM5_9RHOO
MTPLALVGQRVALRPIAPEYADGLALAASDGLQEAARLTNIPAASGMAQYIEQANAGLAAGHMRPFATTLRDSGEIVGSTRFWRIEPGNRKCEIGHTWLASRWHGSFVNAEAKYLMLRYAFEHMQCIRVHFQTDVLNLRSAAALRKIGATEEGVARHERIMADGRIRDSLQFSIIHTEWPQLRERQEAALRALGIEPVFVMEGA